MEDEPEPESTPPRGEADQAVLGLGQQGRPPPRNPLVPDSPPTPTSGSSSSTPRPGSQSARARRGSAAHFQRNLFRDTNLAASSSEAELQALVYARDLLRWQAQAEEGQRRENWWAWAVWRTVYLNQVRETVDFFTLFLEGQHQLALEADRELVPQRPSGAAHSAAAVLREGGRAAVRLLLLLLWSIRACGILTYAGGCERQLFASRSGAQEVCAVSHLRSVSL